MAMAEPVVIDNGGFTVKTGFAGEPAPRTVFPGWVGEPRHKGVVLATGDKEYYVGNAAQERRGCLGMARPVQDGFVESWTDIERLWEYTFYSSLRVAPEDHPVMMSEYPSNPEEKREKTTEIMFERFFVPGLHLGVSSVLALYSSGRTTGLVVDSGRDVSMTLPVFEGYPLTRHMNKMNVGGHCVTQFLVSLLAEKGYGFTTDNELDIANYMKEASCYITNEPSEMDMAASGERIPTVIPENGGPPDDQIMTFRLPDGQDIHISAERHVATEIMFQPNLVSERGVNIKSDVTGAVGLDQMCFSSIGKCDSEIRKSMYENIELAGGNSLFPGISQRIGSGIIAQYKNKFPNESVVTVNISAAESRLYSTWLGASMLATLPMFPQLMISRAEYDEYGPSIVHTKCF